MMAQNFPFFPHKRSAVLYQINEFKACLRDVERAIQSGYPVDLRHKLLDRKGKCLMRLGVFSQAIIVLGEAISSAQKNITDEKKLKPFLTDAQKNLKTCSSKKSASLSLEKVTEEEKPKLPMLTGVDPHIPALSQSVKIVYSPKVSQFSIKTFHLGD